MDTKQLRTALIQMQVALKKAPHPVLVIIAGVEASGKGDVVQMLNTWLDPRGVDTYAFDEPTDEERERPPMWRYWRCMPRNGRIGIHIGSWYADVLRSPARKGKQQKEADRTLAHIARVERLLARSGVLIVKCWLDLSREAQGERLKKLKSDPDTAWRVAPEDWASHRHYSQHAKWSQHVRKLTHSPKSPWQLIDATSPRKRDFAVGRHVLDRFALHAAAQRNLRAKGRRNSMKPLRPAACRALRELPLDHELGSDEYYAKIDKWLGRLHKAARQAFLRKRAIVWVFEGWDAAGKGGAIRRLAEAIDPRDFRVIPVSKPTAEELSFHYLWRFWTPVPRSGRVAIYDRSWYGRVLVERIEGFAADREWRAAYDEINEFESELTDFGIIVIKFWLHISKAEQLRRFHDREGTQYKRHKMEAEDWRNRRRWHDYEAAVGDMIALTSKPAAPWHVIPANNKRFARLKIIKTSCKLIEDALANIK